MSDRRERIATAALAGMLANALWPVASAAKDSVEYADALIAALGEPEPALVTLTATYGHPATGREFYLSRNGVGGYSWIAHDGARTLDTGSAATEREAIAQAVAAVERG